MDRFRLVKYLKFLIKIANLFFINKFAYKRARWLCILMNIGFLFHFLISKFIQLQLVPISMPFILNGFLASYNGMFCTSYSELFRRLGSEFSVQYDRAKHWKISEIRELLNEAYTIYASLYLSVNVYNLRLSPELSNLYNTLRKFLIFLSNEPVKPKGIDFNNLVNIDIYTDYNSAKDKVKSMVKLTSKLNSEHYISFLSLVHSENSKFVTDQHVIQVLIEFPDLSFFEQIVSYANHLYNICNVLNLEGNKEHSRGFISHLFFPPNYGFGNLVYMRSLLIYKFKAVNSRIVSNQLTGEVIDTLFIPSKDFLSTLQRSKYTNKLTPNSHNNAISMLFGSDIYCKVMDCYRGVNNVLVYAGPNAACYEFHAFQSEIPTLIEAGNSILLYNYTSVANSIGVPKITNITKNNKFLINHVLNNMGMVNSTNTHGVEDANTNKDASGRINYYGFSLGGYFILKMCEGSEMKFMVFNKTFGDLRNLSMRMVGRFVGPLLPLFNLNSNTIDEFYKLKTNKIITVDVKDEIIPVKCSLPNELVKRTLLPGINKLTKSFIDYKFKTLQIFNDSIKSTANTPNSNSTNSDNSANSSNTTANSNCSVSKLMCSKNLFNLMLYNINSIGEMLLNLLENEAENNLKEEIQSTNEFFTKLLVYGSVPNHSISSNSSILKRKKIEPYSLCNLYSILSELDLNTNYFSVNTNDGDKLIKVPVRVAVYFSVLLEDNTIVVPRDNDYYLDYSSVSETPCEANHLYKFLKNDLKNFGVSRFQPTPLKLLAYFRLCSLLNVFYIMNKVNDFVEQVGDLNKVDVEKLNEGEVEKTKSVFYDIAALNELCGVFLYNIVQLLIEEPFGELTTLEQTAGNVSYEFHLNKFRNEYQKFGVVIPEFVGHNEQNPFTLALIKDLIKHL
ncbi:putative integral membrane protein [Theileria parva strain Muguga]|uniref:Uncharacterized protein n=1 Tax=Theileria parva TaxID=5875 RepID=Q4MZA0_THEPA|nr:putative integral membrane protein [Theileria parva strain Muguga]EAN31116.1 putative integral membrane protein [Theileria parva strain Muguga]|eukprot:XP_763399.1 hypothetical protein [Theileria parva strain Muguga]